LDGGFGLREGCFVCHRENILLNGATLGRYVRLKGRVERGVFTNWARRFRYAPKRFAKPTTEHEIVELIQNAGSVRVFGSGHSFKAGVIVSEEMAGGPR
jgi:FAD/FMN-containing dehydrogenase